VTICTKFGRTPARQPQFEVAYLRSSLEDSLKRLQTDYVDILLLHSPPRELLFNIFQQNPVPAFQPAASKGVGLIAKVPLDSGWLSGKYCREDQFADLRRRWSPEVVERRAALVEQLAACLPGGMPLAQAALQYVLAQPAIATAIPGARNAAQVRENARAAEGSLPSDVTEAIYSFWEREIKNNPLPW
jgi:aryl-alcohol dehydrogenase-like predicted oxidoreductase